MSSIEISERQISAYLDLCFGYAEEGLICLRGIGEKGTDLEGSFSKNTFLKTSRHDLIKRVAEISKEYADKKVGAFLVPATFSNKVLSDQKATESRLKEFCSICLDLDCENADGIIKEVSMHIGAPSMIVASGGETEQGHLKLHAYWKLTEPTSDVGLIKALREELAVKTGGDVSFKRAPQVIRIPGTAYQKSGAQKLCRIVHQSDIEFDIDELKAEINRMPVRQGCEEAYRKFISRSGSSSLPLSKAGSGMDYSGAAGKDSSQDQRQADLNSALVTPVYEGGTEDRNRWSEFSRVAGHYIHCVREGRITLFEASEKVKGWVSDNMRPAWPEERLVSEWQGLVEHDIREKGPFEDFTPLQGETPPERAVFDLTLKSPHRITKGDVPVRKFLVEHLVPAGKKALLVAEGGAGKTQILMELSLKLACSSAGVMGLTWMGEKIDRDVMSGGSVVMITAEDDEDELSSRWASIDPDRKWRNIAGDRLVTLCMENLGGAFPLVDPSKRGKAQALHPSWAGLLVSLNDLHQRSPIKLIIIDTFNAFMHGDENSSQAVAEFVRALAPVKEFEGCAIMMTHHLRKSGKNPPSTLDEMKEAARGSNALQNAFRTMLVLWESKDWYSRMRGLGLDPERGQCYFFGVAKANFPEALRGTKTLIRQPGGYFQDYTKGDPKRHNYNDESLAWMELAVELAERFQVPFNLKHEFGPYVRQRDLPIALQGRSRRETEGILQALLIHERRVVTAKLMSGGRTGIGIPGGAIDKGEGVRNPGSLPASAYDGYYWDTESRMIQKR